VLLEPHELVLPLNTKQKIGLFGGSFDPVHLGHLLMAQAACEEAGLHRLHFIPAAQSPFKPGSSSAPAADRLRLLRLALAGRSDYEVDPQEIERGGVSYSIETVRNYSRRFPDAQLLFLIGADHIPTLPQWKDAGELAHLVRFLAIPRPGQAEAVFPAPFAGTTLHGHPLFVSASEIRARVKAGKSIEHLVTREVAEAIRNYRLYL